MLYFISNFSFFRLSHFSLMVTVTVVTVLFCHIYILSRILMSHPQDSDSVLNIRFSKRKVERILKNSSDICSFTHFLLLLHKINCTWQFENEFSLRSLALSLHKNKILDIKIQKQDRPDMGHILCGWYY